MHALTLGVLLSVGLGTLAPRPEPAAPRQERTFHEVRLEAGLMLVVKAELNGHALRFLVDTGASQNVLSKLRAAALGIEGVGRLPAMGVGGQMVQLARVETLRVGSWTQRNTMFAIMSLAAINKTGAGFDGILGIPFLGEFKLVEWELGARTLRLGEYLPGETKPQNPIEKMLGGGLEKMFERMRNRAKPTPAARPDAGEVAAGADLERAGAQLRGHFGLPADVGLVVARVAVGGPAARAGLRVGDLITLVDGEPARDTDQLDTRLEELGEGAVTVELFRKGERLKVRVRHP